MAAALDHDDSRIDMGTLLSAVWQRLGRIVWVTAGLLAITYAVLLFVPKMYESSASILVEQRDSSFLRASNDTGAGASSISDDMAIASQVELVQSRDTLLSVIESEDLKSVTELNTASPGIIGLLTAFMGPPPKRDITEVVLTNVRDRLTVIQERDSRVITVYFRSEDPVLAARVANAVANAHVSRRAGLVISDTADASRWLESEIDKLRQKVAEADAKVANFRIENDLYNGADGTASLVDQQLSDIAAQITQSQERQSTATSRATVLRALIQQGKPIDSVPAIQDSATIAQLAEQKSRLQSEKAELSARLLPSHPSLVALNAQIAEINQQITQEGGRIADALEAEADIEASIEASLRDQLTRLKATASGDLTNGVTLAELEREAKAQRDLLETYLVRFREASSRTDASSALPDVRVVTAAAPATVPASPKTTLILIAVAVISLAGQIGQILLGELVSGRALVEGGSAGSRRSARADDEPDMGDRPQAPEPDAAPRTAMTRSDAPLPPARPVPVLEAVISPARRASDADTESEDDADQMALDLEESDYPPETGYPPEPGRQPTRRAYERPREARDPEVETGEREPYEQPASEVPAPPRQSTYVPRAEQPERAANDRRPPRLRALPASLRPLVEAISKGRERIVLIAGLGDPAFAASVAEHLAEACSRSGLGLATIDAASERISANAGLGDLLAGAASYGDVVHTDQAGQMARVPWGRQKQFDTDSSHGITLAEALSDIYNVVLISVGAPGPDHNMGVFAGVSGYLVVASSVPVDQESEEDLQADAADMGFDRMQIVSLDDEGMQVA